MNDIKIGDYAYFRINKRCKGMCKITNINRNAEYFNCNILYCNNKIPYFDYNFLYDHEIEKKVHVSDKLKKWLDLLYD